MPHNHITNGLFDKAHNTPIAGNTQYAVDQYLVNHCDIEAHRNSCMSKKTLDVFRERLSEIGTLPDSERLKAEVIIDRLEEEAMKC